MAWTPSIRRFPDIYAPVPSWYCGSSALTTILEDDLCQVRIRSKEDAKKALGSEETDDERRLKTLLIEDERPLSFPIHWQNSKSILSQIGRKSKSFVGIIRLWAPEARVYLNMAFGDHFLENLANIAEDYRLEDALDMLWKIAIRQVRQGKKRRATSR